MKRNIKILPALAAALALLLGLARAQPALAHTRVELGPYVLIIGWANEPPIVGERNAVVLQVTEDGQPITGLEATLVLTLEYAGRTFRANLAPGPEPGWYHAEVFPTVRGQYEVHLAGTIADLAVDERIAPEEVLAGAVLQFPEPAPDPRDLSLAVDELEQRLGTAYALAIAGIAAGIVGAGLAVFGLVRQRQ